jgi:hypothetical protein
MLPAPRCFCFVGAGWVKVHRPSTQILPKNYGRLMEGIMRHPLFGSAIAAVLVANTAPTAAQTRNPVFTADKEACFGRVYDRTHLSTHPDQKATSIHVFRSLGHRPESEKWYPGERDEEIKRFRDSGQASVTTFVTFRDRRGNFYNHLTCSKEDRDGVFCAIECDGGSFKLKRENANSTLLTNNGFVLIGGCGEEVAEPDMVHFSPGKDDRVFRLETKTSAVCRAEEQKVNAIPAGKPLRERFTEDEAFCFGRDYDAAHLGSHPQQMVASLRVGRLDPAAEKSPDNAYKWWWYNVKLSVSLTLKTGGKVTDTRYTCDPEEGSWGCRRESVSDAPSACTDRSISLVRGPDNDIMVRNTHSGLPITKECETAPTGEQYPKRPLTRSDDKLFRLSRMPIDACRSQ